MNTHKNILLRCSFLTILRKLNLINYSLYTFLWVQMIKLEIEERLSK